MRTQEAAGDKLPPYGVSVDAAPLVGGRAEPTQAGRNRVLLLPSMNS